MMSMERRPRPVLTNAAPAPRAAGDVMGVRWGRMQGWEKVGSGGVTLTFGVGLTQTGSAVDLDPATPTIIGGIREAPAGDGYVRRNGAWTNIIDGGTF